MADLKGVEEGRRRNSPSIATAGAIKHKFKPSRKSEQVKNWDREAVRGILIQIRDPSCDGCGW